MRVSLGKVSLWFFRYSVIPKGSKVKGPVCVINNGWHLAAGEIHGCKNSLRNMLRWLIALIHNAVVFVSLNHAKLKNPLTRYRKSIYLAFELYYPPQVYYDAGQPPMRFQVEIPIEFSWHGTNWAYGRYPCEIRVRTPRKENMCRVVQLFAVPQKSTNYLETYTTWSCNAWRIHPRRRIFARQRRTSISHPIKRDPEVLLTIFDQTRDHTMRANVGIRYGP